MNAADAAAAAAAAAAVATGFCGENTAHFKQALPNTHTHTTHTAGLTKGLAAGEWPAVGTYWSLDRRIEDSWERRICS